MHPPAVVEELHLILMAVGALSEILHPFADKMQLLRVKMTIDAIPVGATRVEIDPVDTHRHEVYPTAFAKVAA